VSDEDPGARRRWTSVYLQFSLAAEERHRLDEYLRRHDFTLGMRLRQALDEVLREAGVEPPKSAPHRHD
jgi:hypothetical protein